MCIALLSTAHPAYSLILLSNRDEFIARPTAYSGWWEKPFEHVLAGRDLQRKEKGTWLGVTSDGRIAVLTNFREEGLEVLGDKSRGAMVTAWLQPPPDGETKNVEDFAHSLIEDIGIHDVGGFSMIYGHLRKDRASGLAIISNRTKSAGEILRIAKTSGETHGLSNSHFGDTTWPKVVHGELLLSQAIKSNISRGDGEEVFVESLFDILSVDTLPKRKHDEDIVAFMRQLRNSIFIPTITGEVIEAKAADTTSSTDHISTSDKSVSISNGGLYGTQKQTVILVNTSGHVTWIERTVSDGQISTTLGGRERRYSFQLEAWES